MSSWHNYGIAVTDEDVLDDVVEALEETGLDIYSARSNVKATDFGPENVSVSEVKRALRPFRGEGVSGFISVNANDTSDTAEGQIYKVEKGSWEKGRSKWSGAESTRRNWMGLSYNGVRVDGGKR